MVHLPGNRMHIHLIRIHQELTNKHETVPVQNSNMMAGFIHNRWDIFQLLYIESCHVCANTNTGFDLEDKKMLRIQT